MNRTLHAITAVVMLATGISVLAQDSYTKPSSDIPAKVRMTDPFALQRFANPRDPSTIDWSNHPKQLHPSIQFSRKGLLKTPKIGLMKEAAASAQVRAYYWELMSGIPEGLYSFSWGAGDSPQMVAPMGMLRGYENGNGRYFGISLSYTTSGERRATLFEYDSNDWSLIQEKSCDPALSFTDIAMDPTSGDVYGCFYVPETDGYCWGSANFETESRTLIKEIDVESRLEAVACDDNGQYYAIDVNGMISKVNKVTGDMESIVPLDLEYTTCTGGCFNNENGTLIIAADTDDLTPFLAEVNLSTGATSTVFQAPWFSMLISPYCVPKGNSLAPAQPGLEISCSEGAQSVDYVLTMPTELGNGDPLVGSVSYSLSADGVEVLSGNAEPGQSLEGNLPIEVNGFVTFVLTASNADGASPVARTVCFVGTGSPAAPSSVYASHDGQSVNISWQAVTLSTNDGYIDPALIRYEITGIDGETIATDVEGTTYTIPFPVPEKGCVDLQYTVRAIYDGKYSDPVSSARIFVGTLCAPFELQMDIYNFGRHQVVDANNDGRTWIHTPPYTYYVFGFDTADDWLISPEFKLEAGKIYPFKATAENLSSGDEILEIKWGREGSVAGMTEVIAAPTQIPGSIDVMTYLRPQQSGSYFIGFHALSPALQGFLGLNSYSIGDPVNATTPSTVDDLTVLGAWDGSLKASATFKAPVVDIAGDPLAKNVDIEIRLGDDVVNTISGVTPGQNLSFDFDSSLFPQAGYYDFYFSCSNEDGTSVPLRYREYVGPKVPTEPDNFKITKENGNFFTSWDAVTKAADGTDILPSNIKYKVSSLMRTFIGLQIDECLTPEPITETKFQVFPNETDRQELAYYGVQSVNLGVESAYIRYNSYLLGTPYSLPVKFSAINNNPENYFYEGFISDNSVYVGWSFLDNFEAQDQDGEWMGVWFEVPQSQGAIKTGKISLAGATNPVLSFFEFCFSDNTNIDANKTDVIVEADGVEYLVYTVDNSQLTPGVWNRISCDLSQFAGKTIRVELCAKCVNVAVSAWDNLQIRERVDYKMAGDLKAPSKATTGIPFDVNVCVLNDGEKDQLKPYSVTLFRNGEEAETKDFSDALGAGSYLNVAFNQTLGADAPEVAEYSATINYKDGSDSSLEASTGKLSVARRVLDIPAVQGLHGEFVEDGVALNWLPADVDQSDIAPVTESFEDCDSWAKEAYEWTFLDLDKFPVGGFNDLDVPNVDEYNESLAFIVWDTSYEGAGDEHSAHTGKKLLSTMHCANWDMQTDDWAVSPTLSGETQTISVWARILEPFRTGEMAIYYSMEENPTSPADFEKCEEFTAYAFMDSTDWAEFTATIPAGARHFAIHSTGKDAYMLLIDDVSFVPAAPQIVGYNVYCDGVRVNEAPVPEVNFLHSDVAEGTHVYRVNALYDKGASELSEPVSVMVSAIIVNRDMMVSVTGLNHRIQIRGAENQNVRIASLDGKVIYTGNGDAVVPVTPDLYMVTVGATTFKILVR